MTERVIKRGDIYRVALDPTIGREIKKTRRCVVISNNQQNLYSPLLIVIPTTSDMAKLYSWEVVIYSEGKERKILTDQIRSVDKKRLREYKGQVSYEILTKIEKALGVVLALRELQGLYDLTQIPTKGVKFTNFPTPQSTYTLSKETLE
ncbi:10998_t:CDS:2, partial [Cetraspora pellucida]